MSPAFNPAPNLFVIGAMKAGTTSLHAVLNSHPAIYMAAIKEPNFFCSDLWEGMAHIAPADTGLLAKAHTQGLHTARLMDPSLYQALFPAEITGMRYRGEASPSYLRSQVAAAAIAEVAPEARVIAILRDPVERAISHHRMEANEARLPADFLAAIDSAEDPHGLVDSGMYGAALQRVFNAFPRGQVLVLDMAELADKAALIVRLSSFLDVAAVGFTAEGGVQNAVAQSRFPALNRLLAVSGAKELIRRTLPRGAIERGKQLYYGRKKGPDGAPEAWARLGALYRADMARLTELLGPETPPWATRYTGG